MKTFILMGEIVVSLFQYEDWSLLEKAILEQNIGDIISWNKELADEFLMDLMSDEEEIQFYLDNNGMGDKVFEIIRL